MKILVAGDDLVLADCLVEAPLEDGHVLSGIAATVAEAVALARLHRPDIAILDMHICDGECGTDIADQLAEAGLLGRAGVLYVSGEAPRVHQQARVGHACLGKPYTLGSLNATMKIVLQIVDRSTPQSALPHGLRLLDHPAPSPSDTVLRAIE